MLMLILVPDTWAQGRRKRWQWANSSRRKGRHGGNTGHASFGGAVANLALVTPAKYRGVTSNSKEKLKHCRSSDQALR